MKDAKEINAFELLKRERFDIHGSISIGVDSEGRWETELELYKQLSPSLSVGVSFAVGQWDRWGGW
jgi:hypothetical protein